MEERSSLMSKYVDLSLWTSLSADFGALKHCYTTFSFSSDWQDLLQTLEGFVTKHTENTSLKGFFATTAAAFSSS